VPETLVAALDDLAELYDAGAPGCVFWAEYEGYLADIGPPVVTYTGPRLSQQVGVWCGSSVRT